MTISVFDRVKNIVGKGEIACTSNFSFSHNVFKMFSQTRQKVSLRGKRLKHVYKNHIEYTSVYGCRISKISDEVRKIDGYRA